MLSEARFDVESLLPCSLRPADGGDEFARLDESWTPGLRALREASGEIGVRRFAIEIAEALMPEGEGDAAQVLCGLAFGVVEDGAAPETYLAERDAMRPQIVAAGLLGLPQRDPAAIALIAAAHLLDEDAVVAALRVLRVLWVAERVNGPVPGSEALWSVVVRAPARRG